MSTTGHTQTPWRFTDDGRATTVRADDAEYPKPIAEIWDNGDDRQANAAFIVTAVNAYDKHRALIETIFKAVSDHPENSALGSAVRQIVSAGKDGL